MAKHNVTAIKTKPKKGAANWLVIIKDAAGTIVNMFYMSLTGDLIRYAQDTLNESQIAKYREKGLGEFTAGQGKDAEYAFAKTWGSEEVSLSGGTLAWAKGIAGISTSRGVLRPLTQSPFAGLDKLVSLEK